MFHISSNHLWKHSCLTCGGPYYLHKPTPSAASLLLPVHVAPSTLLSASCSQIYVKAFLSVCSCSFKCCFRAVQKLMHGSDMVHTCTPCWHICTQTLKMQQGAATSTQNQKVKKTLFSCLWEQKPEAHTCYLPHTTAYRSFRQNGEKLQKHPNSLWCNFIERPGPQ